MNDVKDLTWARCIDGDRHDYFDSVLAGRVVCRGCGRPPTVMSENARIVNGVELKKREGHHPRHKVHIEYERQAPGIRAVYVDGRELWCKRVAVDHTVMDPAVVTIELRVMPEDLTTEGNQP